MTKLFLSLISFFGCAACLCQPVSRHAEIHSSISVHPEKRYLQTAEGKPFFWLGDTAWELFHRLNREEIQEYLAKRRARSFNVIQVVALAEFDGLRTPNADPRTGKVVQQKINSGRQPKTFKPPKRGQDWVLVLDDAGLGFAAPGIF